MGSYFKFGPVVQEMLFKEKRKSLLTDDGPRPITIPHIEPAFSSGELKIKMLSA